MMGFWPPQLGRLSHSSRKNSTSAPAPARFLFMTRRGAGVRLPRIIRLKITLLIRIIQFRVGAVAEEQFVLLREKARGRTGDQMPLEVKR
jgi:hypothetical protein